VTAVRKLFLDGIDVGLWADRRTLKNVVRTIRDVDNFELKFNKKNRLGTAFPVALVGGIQVYYGFWDSANHANDYELFSGRLLFYEWGTEKSSVRGKLRCQFVTPLQELKRIMEYVAFDPLVQDTDDKRVRRLFELADLPNWDYTTGTTTTPSITYPSGAGFEPLTEYEQKSIEYILDDIASDPGRPGDTGYPVHGRRWWISGRLTTPATPSAGVTWVVNYRDALTAITGPQELKDRRTNSADTAVEYGTDARPSYDWREVIRSIYIAGPRQEANPSAGRTL
jgi:hypothetical protein